MCCRIVELREKQVICIKDGTILGCVCDVEVDTCTGQICSIVLYNRSHWFSFWSKPEDCVIPWKCIEVIGRDTILVNCDPPRPSHKKIKKSLLNELFNS